MAPLPTVFVMGGGVAGLTLAARLHYSKRVRIVLADPKEYFELSVTMPRALVDVDVANNKLIYPYSDFCMIDEFIQDKVAELHPRHAVMASGRTVRFDYAVVATGSIHSSPLLKGAINSLADRRKQLQDGYRDVYAAKHIVIGGGGFTGCEVAAELSELPHKPKITIVHSHASLMPGTSAKTQLYVRKLFKQRGINVILNQRLVWTADGDVMYGSADMRDAESDDYELHEYGGTQFNPKPDLVLWCTGSKPAGSDAVAAGLGPKAVTKKGYIRVNAEMQLENYPNLFAIGDCTNVKEFKTAGVAVKHAELVAKNLLSIIVLGTVEAGLKAYVPNSNDKNSPYLNLGSDRGIFVKQQRPNLLTMTPLAAKGMMKQHAEIVKVLEAEAQGRNRHLSVTLFAKKSFILPSLSPRSSVERPTVQV